MNYPVVTKVGRVTFLGLLDPEEVNSTTLLNICNYLPLDEAQRLTKLDFVATTPWEVDISFITRVNSLYNEKALVINEAVDAPQRITKFSSLLKQPEHPSVVRCHRIAKSM